MIKMVLTSFAILSIYLSFIIREARSYFIKNEYNLDKNLFKTTIKKIKNVDLQEVTQIRFEFKNLIKNPLFNGKFK